MLIEVTIYVPHVPEVLRDGEVTRRASAIFGGCSWLPGELHGAWEDGDGTLHEDTCRRLVVAVDGLGDLALIVAFAREVGRLYSQKSMYVSALGVSECVEVGQ